MSDARVGPSGPEVAEQALRLAGGGSLDAAGELVTVAEGRKPPLLEAHRLLVDRLHRRSDDFAATGALRLVATALSRIALEGLGVRSIEPRRGPLPVRRGWRGRRARRLGERRQTAPPEAPRSVAGQGDAPRATLIEE